MEITINNGIYDYLKWAINTYLIINTDNILKNFTSKIDNPLNNFKDKTKMAKIRFIDDNHFDIYKYLYQQQKSNESKSNFYYRGIAKKDFKLASGIYRSNINGVNGLREDEDFYFNKIQIECPIIFKNLSTIEKLTYMQHYNCPTRLLDITSNPLVALYFACNTYPDQDGAVYMFSFSNDEILLPKDPKIKVLANLAELTENERTSLAYQSYLSSDNNKFRQSSNSKYSSEILEKFFQLLNRNEHLYERNLIPFDLLAPQVFQPYKDNPRLIKQDGAFIISGLDFNEEDSHQKILNFVTDKIIIPSNQKDLILSQLNRLGINESTLFPEIEHISNHLRNISTLI